MNKFTCYICKGPQTEKEVELYFELCHKCWVWFTDKKEQSGTILDKLTSLKLNSAENS